MFILHILYYGIRYAASELMLPEIRCTQLVMANCGTRDLFLKLFTFVYYCSVIHILNVVFVSIVVAFRRRFHVPHEFLQ